MCKIPTPDQNIWKTFITGLGSCLFHEPRVVTDTPGYSTAVSAVGGVKV